MVHLTIPLDPMVWFDDLIDSNLNFVEDQNAALLGKSIGLFFGSTWCPMVEKLLPTLRKFYENHLDNVAIIFVSSDGEEHNQAYQEFVKSCPWYAVTRGSDMESVLKQKYGIWSGREQQRFKDAGEE